MLEEKTYDYIYTLIMLVSRLTIYTDTNSYVLTSLLREVS